MDDEIIKLKARAFDLLLIKEQTVKNIDSELEAIYKILKSNKTEDGELPGGQNQGVQHED